MTSRNQREGGYAGRAPRYSARTHATGKRAVNCMLRHFRAGRRMARVYGVLSLKENSRQTRYIVKRVK